MCLRHRVLPCASDVGLSAQRGFADASDGVQGVKVGSALRADRAWGGALRMVRKNRVLRLSTFFNHTLKNVCVHSDVADTVQIVYSISFRTYYE